jgi:hypothetical protein
MRIAGLTALTICAILATGSASRLESRLAVCSFIPPDSMPPLFTEAWVRWVVVRAEAIARVRVIGLVADRPDSARPKLKWEQQIETQVVEVMFGTGVPSTLYLHGTLHDSDVYPRDSLSYLKSGSLGGACHRAEFRRGGEHLLLLWRLPDSTWTAQGMPHAPSMIQVRGPDDPWVHWVRAARTRGSR